MSPPHVPDVASQQRVDMGFGQKRQGSINALSYEPLRDDRKLNTIHSTTVVRTASTTAQLHPLADGCAWTTRPPPDSSRGIGLTTLSGSAPSMSLQR